MNVLIVDDQVKVVEGIYNQIDWEKIGIRNVYEAYSAYEARALFSIYEINILLCDIEMPAENGLSLFKWVKENYPNTQCIFLSAHAEFEYAQLALQLGSFDYILQPASYELIQNKIIGALNKINSLKQMEMYCTYGEFFHEKEEVFVDLLLSDWLIGKKGKTSNVCKDFERLKIDMTENDMVHPILINLTQWHSKAAEWQEQLLKYALCNILSELFETYQHKILFISLENNQYVLLAYNKNHITINVSDIKKQLDIFISTMNEYMHCSFACYIGQETPIKEIPAALEELFILQKNNVALASKVFILNSENEKCSIEYFSPNMDVWSDLLKHGQSEMIKDSVAAYLQTLSQNGQLTSTTLAEFFQDFIQMFYNVLDYQGIKAHKIFTDSNNTALYINAYNSIESMMQFVSFIADFCNNTSGVIEDKNLVERIIEYIHANIEKDIRRTDIANDIFFSTDYISRLFKKETGISLKDFIIQEKMKVAQKLLVTTNLSISIIASKVGYSNFSHFSQTFRKEFGAAPAEYRHFQQNKFI